MIKEMGTRANLRHIWARRIFGFRRNARPEICLHFGSCLIIRYYVNCLALFRSCLGPITDDFADRLPLERGPVPFLPGVTDFDSRSMTVASSLAISQAATAAGGADPGDRKARISGTGTPPPLPYLFAVGFFKSFLQCHFATASVSA